MYVWGCESKGQIRVCESKGKIVRSHTLRITGSLDAEGIAPTSRGAQGSEPWRNILLISG
ncbi:hypothetical protein DP73_06425 [Desulfosporosinus sp. HMP52]|nr:hypothetical protein DP73_06425 [Desulfosporosinus sp. HMP52]